jgi:predicted metalloprotease with PDZ domain
VTFDASTPLVAHVEAALPAGSAALQMADWGGDPFSNGWASRVRHLTVTSAGTPVTVTLTPKAAKWTVASDAPLHLAYVVDLSFAKEKWPYGNEQAGYYDNHALFVVSKALFIFSDAPGSHSIVIEAPKSWTVVTPWESLGAGRFRVDDTKELIDNSLVVGMFAHHTFHTGNFEVTIALLGEMRRAEPIVTDALQKVLANYGRIFPDTPRSRYLMTLFLSDDIDAEAFAHSAAFTEREVPSSANLIGWGNTLAHRGLRRRLGGGFLPRHRDSYGDAEPPHAGRFHAAAP